MATPEPQITYDQFGFIENYVCPSCSSKLKLDHTDDIGTKWFKCEKCNQQTSKPKSPILKELEALDKEVNRILTSQNISLEIDTHLANIFAGEETNRLPLFVLLLSGKFPEAEMKQMILIKGTEGSGKSTLMQIADSFKTKDVGRFSEHALDYTNLKDFEILRLKEIGSMDQETQGTSTIKFLSSDDKGYTVEVTVKDKETNKFTTEEHIIPPITVLSSTTRIVLDPQYMRRNWIFNPDESSDQTKRVCQWRARLEKEKAEVSLGLKSHTSLEFSKSILERLIEKLEPCSVVIPFPESLTEILNMKNLRVRGDYSKILVFIKLYAFLNQNRLPKIQIEKGKTVFVTPSLCIEALRAIEKPLVSMTSNLEERTRKLIDVFKELGFDIKDTILGKTEREKISVRLGKSEKTIRTYLNEWESVGYCSSDGKKPKTFTLLYGIEEIEVKTSGISAKLESANDLVNKMKEEALKWFNSLSEIGNLWVEINRETFLTPYQIDLPIPKLPISNTELSNYKPFIEELPSNNRQIKQLPILTQDNLDKILPHLPEKFEDGVFQKIAREKADISSFEAELLFNKLVKEEKVMRVDDGKFWSFVR
jgi:hypothetical protein